MAWRRKNHVLTAYSRRKLEPSAEQCNILRAVLPSTKHHSPGVVLNVELFANSWHQHEKKQQHEIKEGGDVGMSEREGRLRSKHDHSTRGQFPTSRSLSMGAETKLPPPTAFSIKQIHACVLHSHRIISVDKPPEIYKGTKAICLATSNPPKKRLPTQRIID